MTRGEFLQTFIPAVGGSLLLNGLPVHSYAKSTVLQLLAEQSLHNGRIFVLIQMNGGNDGLNTLIPIDQYSNLSIARKNILIPENKILKLNGTHTTGLHPEMSGMQELYNQGYLSVVQGVSYPNPDFSHFRASDIWLSASDSKEYVGSGWVGRFLHAEYPDFPLAYPNADMPDPLAIQIGSYMSPILQGPALQMGMSVSDPASFYQFASGTVGATPDTPYGHELKFIRYIQQQSQKYFQAIKKAADKGKNISTRYPADGKNYLSDQLKIVAKLISGGLKTPIYVVNIDGFDTHANQVELNGDTTKGNHAQLLSELSVAINAFQDDLKLLNYEDKVAGMTFSEFGRRIESNASLGTDHGTAAPIFVFGKNVIPGIIGKNPIIPSDVTPEDNLSMIHDFRQVYFSVLKDWFEIDDRSIQQSLFKSYQTLPIFKRKPGTGGDAVFLRNIPNPVTRNTTIRYSIKESGQVSLVLYDMEGRMVRALFEGYVNAGEQSFYFDRGTLPAGVYIYHLRSGETKMSGKMIIIN